MPGPEVALIAALVITLALARTAPDNIRRTPKIIGRRADPLFFSAACRPKVSQLATPLAAPAIPRSARIVPALSVRPDAGSRKSPTCGRGPCSSLRRAPRSSSCRASARLQDEAVSVSSLRSSTRGDDTFNGSPCDGGPGSHTRTGGEGGGFRSQRGHSNDFDSARLPQKLSREELGGFGFRLDAHASTLDHHTNARSRSSKVRCRSPRRPVSENFILRMPISVSRSCGLCRLTMTPSSALLAQAAPSEMS
jgi:hypothetical protein